MNQLLVLENKIAQILLDLPPRRSATESLNHSHLQPLSNKRLFHHCVTVFKCLNGETYFVLT